MNASPDLRDKNVDDVLTLYTSDAIFVDPDQHRYSGPALRKLYEQVVAAFDSDLHLKTLRLTATAIEPLNREPTPRRCATGQPGTSSTFTELTIQRASSSQWTLAFHTNGMDPGPGVAHPASGREYA